MRNYLVRFSLDDLSICKDELGGWHLEGRDLSFPLVEASDFKRIISLLETPVEVAKAALGDGFPYVCVVEVGLNHDSDYWIGLALSWVADVTARDAFQLIKQLKILSTDKAVSQKNRQLARKEFKRLSNVDS